MIISLIAAVSENLVIGKNNSLPWRLPPDMKHFRRLTIGKPVIMGRNTFETLKAPLEERQNIVLTTQPEYKVAGCTIVHSLDEAFYAADEAPEVMIAGGAAIYQKTLPRADRMYLTHIHASFDGDAFFPEFDISQWKEVTREDHIDTKYEYEFSFVEYRRVTENVHKKNG